MTISDLDTRVRKLRQRSYLKFSPRNVSLPHGEDSFRIWISSCWDDENGWLLGHAFNGLLWGRISSGVIVLASDATPSWGASIKEETLLDLRVFNRTEEFRIWRTGEGLKACMVSESDDDSDGCLAFDEKQILIAGDRIGQTKQVKDIPFSLIEGPAGQRHAMPVDWNGRNQRYRLLVRHYVLPDPDTGRLSIQESRLLDVVNT